MFSAERKCLKDLNKNYPEFKHEYGTTIRLIDFYPSDSTSEQEEDQGEDMDIDQANEEAAQAPGRKFSVMNERVILDEG
jgi:hypothetical protein